MDALTRRAATPRFGFLIPHRISQCHAVALLALFSGHVDEDTDIQARSGFACRLFR